MNVDALIDNLGPLAELSMCVLQGLTDENANLNKKVCFISRYVEGSTNGQYEVSAIGRDKDVAIPSKNMHPSATTSTSKPCWFEECSYYSAKRSLAADRDEILTEGLGQKRKKKKTGKDDGPPEPTEHELTMELMKHRRAYNEFAEGYKYLMNVDEIPWPSDAVLRIEVSLDPDPEKAVRTLQKRWHPDRFMNKFRGRMEQSVQPLIQERVTSVAAVINQLKMETS